MSDADDTRGRPFTVTDVHFQLRQMPGMLERLAEIYETTPELLRHIESYPGERIEIWERNMARSCERVTGRDWHGVGVQSNSNCSQCPSRRALSDG